MPYKKAWNDGRMARATQSVFGGALKEISVATAGIGIPDQHAYLPNFPSLIEYLTVD